MTFNLNGGTVTLNTTTTGEAGSTVSDWEFRGTYQKVQWDGSASDPSDLSKTYGFAKGNATIAAGQFVHFAAGAWLKPMRCYLVYNGSTEGGTYSSLRNQKRVVRGASFSPELPSRLTKFNPTFDGNIGLRFGNLTSSPILPNLRNPDF